MMIRASQPVAHAMPGEASTLARKRAMWINQDRVVYVGLVGQPSIRNLGAYAIYLSPRGEHRVSVEGGPDQHGPLSFVPPYVPHQLASDERTICTILIEPETVDPEQLPAFFTQPQWRDKTEIIEGLLRALARFTEHPGSGFHSTAQFDLAFFGAPLVCRGIDARVANVVQFVKAQPQGHMSAEECAERVNLSVSRFLHLFKGQFGVAFRNYRAWHRARSILRCVTQEMNLVDVALDAGYPDSSHFSHSMRHYYGRAPRSIFVGSRKLTLVHNANV